MITEPYEQRMPVRYGGVDSFDVQGAVTRVTDSVLKHKLIILLCVIICIGLVWTYIQLFPPVYKAEVMVQAEAEEDKAREGFYSSWNTFRKSELSSEVELMTSTPVAKKVVQELGLTYDDVYHTPLKQVLYLWEQSTIGNWYRKAKNWVFPPRESPFKPTAKEIELARTVTGFKDGARLEPVADTQIGYLVVKGPTYQVAEHANRLVDAYTEYRQELFSNEAETAFHSLTKEVARAELERNKVMKSRLVFEVKHGLALGLAKDKAVMENWAVLETMIQALEFKLNNLEAGYQVISEQLAKESPTLLSSDMKSRNPIHDGIRDSVFKMQKDLNGARLIYRPGSPELKDMETQIADLKAQLPGESKMVVSATDRGRSMHYEQLRGRKQEIEVEVASARAELQKMYQTQKENEARIALIPALEHEYLVLQRDQEMALSKMKLLREKLMQADVSRVTAMSAPPTLRVVEYASPPEKPSWPNSKLLYVVAIMLGSFGGVGLAIIIEMMNNRATRETLLLRHDLPVYATIEVSHRSRQMLRMIRSSDSRSKRPPLALELLRDPDA